MDDLLKAFRGEVSQELDRCDSDLDRLRSEPDGTAALVNLKRLLGTIQEMSFVLGQRQLSETAARGAGALEVALAGGADAVGRAVPIVSDCLKQIRALLDAIGSDDTELGPAAMPSPIGLRKSAGDAMDQSEASTEGKERSAGKLAAPGMTAAPVMRTRARWYRPRNILFAGGSSLLAAAAAAVIALLSVDPNEYRGTIEDAIREATGRQVTIGGVELAISLTPTILLQDVTLANADWGSAPRMIAADRLEAQMSLLPLLRGEFDAKRFVLRGADILLEVDPNGRGNWSFEGGTDAAGSDGMHLVQLGRVAVEDSTLAFRDAATGETERIEVRQLTAHQPDSAAPIQVAIDSTVNGQPVRLSGSLGALRLLDGDAPYPLDLSGEIAGLEVAVKGETARPLDFAGYSLNLTMKGPSLAGLGAMIGSDLPPGSPVELAAKVQDADAAVRFSDISGRIGGSDMAGTVTVLPGSPSWRIDGDLVSNSLKLDDFVAPRPDGGTDDPRIFGSASIPHRWIAKIDMNAKLSAQQVDAGAHRLSDARLEGTIAAGLLSLTDLRFGYVGGTVALKGTLDVNGAAPAWNLQASGRQLAAGDFLDRLLGLTLIGGGRMDIEAALSAAGRSPREIAMTLDGPFGLSVLDGTVNDDLMKLFLTDLEEALSFDGSGARLRCLTAVHAFADGIGKTRQFVADTGAAVVVGQGAVNLRDETIAMRFEPTARELSLAALPVPVDVTGPLARPNVTPDAVGATANVAGEAASIATLGVADAFLEMVGEQPLSNSGPVASCSPLPQAMTAKDKTTSKAAAKAAPADGTQQATTGTAPKKKEKKKKKSSTAGQILDDIGSSLNSVLDGSSSSGSSRTQQGGKNDR